MDELKKEVAPKKKSAFKRFFIRFAVIVFVLLGIYVYWQYFFVFGEGVKSGHLNYAVKKGNLFKTYEGKLIQEGIRSKVVGAIQSNEFEFSIKTQRIFDSLSLNSGKVFDLHYKEFKGIVPWRGNTIYLVDSIIAMRDPVQ